MIIEANSLYIGNGLGGAPPHPNGLTIRTPFDLPPILHVFRAASFLPGVNCIAVESPAARVALAREMLELLDASRTIVLTRIDGNYDHQNSIAGGAARVTTSAASVCLRFLLRSSLVKQNLQHQ